jgi:outer membrane receptor protein involved in Fe transport
MQPRIIALAISTACLAGLPAAASAQAGRGEINGTVIDEAKGVLPGATVTVTHEEQGTQRNAVTGPDGRYVVTTLQPGPYTLRVEMQGFRTQERKGLRLSVGQELTVDFTLEVGGVRAEVTVRGDAPVVEVTTSRIGTNVSNQEIDSLPSLGRNQLALMQTVPGLVPNLSQSTFEGGQYSANGRESTANLFMIDGVYNNDDRLGGNGGQTRVTLDSMAEFQVLTHQYTAEYGGSSGMVVNAVSKSGTNRLAGRAFYYKQDGKWNATNHFLELQGEENPDSGSDVWGFNAGGPIVRNKAFWFFNLERNIIDQAVSLVFPDEAAPLATSFSDAAEIKVWNTFSKIDYQLTSNHSLSFRWVREAATNIGEEWEESLALREAVEVENDAGDHILSGNWTWVIGNTATNEFRVSNVREDLFSGNRQYFDEDFNFIELAGRDQFDIGSMNDHPDFVAGPAALHGSAVVRTYVVEDAFTLTRSGWGGTHTFKMGATYSRNSTVPHILGGNDNGTFQFRHNLPFEPADAFTYPSRFSILLGNIYIDVTDDRANGFVQDKWQVNKKLTFNLGLRYDYQSLTPRTKDAIAPRIGVAYDPTGSGKTVIRGGIGKFYEYMLASTGSLLQQQALISQAFTFDTGEDRAADRGQIPSHACLHPGNNEGRAIISPACRALLTDVRAQVAAGGFVNTEPTLDGDRQMGYLWGYSLGLQRELFPNVGLAVDYVGNRGRQVGLIDINEPRLLSSGQVGRPGPDGFDPSGELIPAEARDANFQRVLQYQFHPDIETDFDSLEISVDKRYSSRWSGRVSYTLARSRDTGIGGFNAKRFTDDLNPARDYGRSSFDNRHAFSMSVNASPWRGLGLGMVLRAYSGYPINETVGSDVNRDRDNNDRPVAGVHDLTRPILSPLDANGMAIRNGIDGEDAFLLDLRFQYIFALPRQNRFGLFWEIYNATNRVNFANPTGNRNSSNFMVPVSANAPRTMQLGVRYTF